MFFTPESDDFSGINPGGNNTVYTTDNRVHRLAMATFLRAFSDDGIFGPLNDVGGKGVKSLTLSHTHSLENLARAGCIAKFLVSEWGI